MKFPFKNDFKINFKINEIKKIKICIFGIVGFFHVWPNVPKK